MAAVRRATVVGSVILGAAIALYAFRDARSSRAASAAPSLDPDVVAVLPFAVRGSQPALLDLRDAIQDVVAARLPGGDGGPRALDPAAVLSALRRSAPSWGDHLPAAVALRVVAGLHAGQLLRGEVAGTPDHLSVEAELVAVPGGDVRARARAEAMADSLPYLADRLIARLLAVQAARDSDELAALTGTSPGALRAYLAGVHAVRLGRVGTGSDATSHFERALFLDSTFGPAGLRLAEAAVVFGMAGLDERWKLDAIWSGRGRLGRGDRELLVAFLGPRYPAPATLAESIVAAERAAAAAPQRAEAWRIAGIQLARFGSMIGYPDWQDRAGAALGRALALDSTDVVTVEFLLRLAVEARDRVAIQRYVAMQLARNPVSPRSGFYRWLAATAVGDSDALAGIRRQFAAIPRLSLRYILDWSLMLGAGLADADRAARRLDEGARRGAERQQVFEAVVPYTLNRGRPVAAARFLAVAEGGAGRRKDVGVVEFRVYAGLLWDGDSSQAAAAAETLAAHLRGAPAGPGQVRARETAACALAHWRLASNDVRGAEAALGLMRRSMAGSPAVESSPVCEAAVEARLAAARRRPDAAAALDRLDSLLRVGSDVRQLLPSVATVIAARLYEARGDLNHALAIMRRRTSWTNQLLSTQLREEGRLAALLGDTAGAMRAYRHYLALRSDPEPSLRPDAERVRAELMRFEATRDP